MHGKSTVAEEFLKITNSRLIDADKLAKNLDFKGSMYLNEIKDLFGIDVISKNGTLNRRALGNIIYNNFNQKAKLDKITFKYVVAETEKKLSELSSQNLDYILIDAPLLFEAKINEKCDYVIAVIAKNKEKIERICLRDDLKLEDAEARLSVQKDDKFFKLNSDFVIENNGNIDEIKYKIERILKSIK